MSTIAVNREIIQWARTRAERSGLTIDALVKRFPKFLAWESGDVQPTLSQLELLARKTFTPLGYFFFRLPRMIGCRYQIFELSEIERFIIQVQTF